MKKVFISLLVIVAGALALTIWKWNTWFGNSPEASYTTPAYPDRIVITPGQDAASSRTFSWRCDTVLAPAMVELFQSGQSDTLQIGASGEVVTSRSGKSAFYRATADGLVPDVTYRYRVITGDSLSRWFDLRIPNETDSLSFISVGDIQDYEDGHTRQIFENIRARHPQVSFWALGGDVIERPKDSFWSYWYSTMDSLVTSTPVVVATGNHEYLKGAIKKLDNRWTYTFSYPHNGPNRFAGRTYSLDFKDVCFITIDTDGLQLPGDYLVVRSWLKKTLAASDKKWKIVMMHHPVYSVRAGRDNFLIRWTFKPVFEQYGVDLVLQGHDHGYSRITTKKTDGTKTTPVYVVSNCSPKLYSIGFDPIHDRLGSDINLYQYVTVKGDSLRLKSFTTDHQLYDDIVVVKQADQVSVLDKAFGISERLELPESYRHQKAEKLKKYEDGKAKRIKESKQK